MTGPGSWRGVYAVLVSPFTSTLALDSGALAAQVEFCIEAGAHGLVGPVVASEFMTLSDTERHGFCKVVAQANRGRIPFVAGVAGTSAAHAVELAVAAADARADALIAMPPYTGGASPVRTFEYFQAIADATPLPLVIQNPPPPFGSPLTTEQLLELVERLGKVVIVKEETLPNPQQVGRLVRAAGERLPAVMGGLGGIYLFNELARGAAGTMPACQFIDVAAGIYELWASGAEREARSRFAALQPALVMERLYGMTFMKECLRRRGVLTNSLTRLAEPPLDEMDLAELDVIWAGLEPHFTWPAATR
jgi:4-hydroxy-tetrahydrodipicolinate synthase